MRTWCPRPLDDGASEAIILKKKLSCHFGDVFTLARFLFRYRLLSEKTEAPGYFQSILAQLLKLRKDWKQKQISYLFWLLWKYLPDLFCFLSAELRFLSPLFWRLKLFL